MLLCCDVALPVPIPKIFMYLYCVFKRLHSAQQAAGTFSFRVDLTSAALTGTYRELARTNAAAAIQGWKWLGTKHKNEHTDVAKRPLIFRHTWAIAMRNILVLIAFKRFLFLFSGN